jgi:pSer/pThr/pTyr-binding forkhead associated (FHA) protein
MSITVVVRSVGSEEIRLTFDGTQRVVIGRGAGSDVRLPDASVSHRHATLRSQGADFVIVDEASTNGTFVGAVPVAPHTSRIVRSGDRVRVGRVGLELRLDQSPVTRDVASATRDLAFALVSQAMAALGADRTTIVRVVEGPDQGTALRLADEGQAYIVGRSAHCSLAVADVDVSREHVRLVRTVNGVLVRDLGTKNGTWLGEARAPDDGDTTWRAIHMMRIGRTVLALEEPVSEALARIEQAADERLPLSEETPKPEDRDERSVSTNDSPTNDAEQHIGISATDHATPGTRRGSRWSAADLLVMGMAIAVLALSLAGLVWLLRG